MATKTLGVKFEIAGVKKAQAGLNNLRKNLNASLKQNKQAVKESIGLNQTVRQELEQSNPDDFVDNYQRTVAAIRNKQYREAVNIYGRPRLNRVIGGYFDGIGNAAGERTFGRLDNWFRKLTGRQEHRETVELGNESIRKLAIAIRNPKDFDRKPSQRDINLGFKNYSSSQGVVGSILEQALLPIKTMQYSFYEGIGSDFGNRFAEGLNKVFEEDLDLSFERKGQVTGKAISYTATSGLDQLNKDADSVKDNYSELRYAVEDGQIGEISQKFDTLFKSIIKSITGIGDSYVRGFRRGSVQIEALRKIDAEVAKLDNVAPDLTGKKKVIYTVGGFAGEKGQRGKAIAEQIKPLVNDQTEVIGAENIFTDVGSPSQQNKLMWGLNSLANVGKINLKGFNPDAVKLAAQVINTLGKNPDVVVDLVGHSAGGFVVEEAQQILNLLGKGDKVKSKTVGTPNVRGGLNADGTTRTMGDGDPFSDLERQGEYFGVSSPTQNIANSVKNHSFQAYLNSNDFVNQILGDSLDPDKLQAQRQNNSKLQGKLIELETLYTKYISTIYQNLDDLGDELSVAPDRLVAKTRRNKLRDRGGEELQRKLDNQNFRQIKLKEETETAVLLSGGLGGAKGRSGAKFAADLNKLVDDPKTQYVGLRNPFTDVLSADDVRNGNAEEASNKVLEMFRQTHELGYNPDAVEIAAQVIDLLNKNPNLKVKVGGYSAGGYPVEDVTELLKSQGVDLSRVDFMGIGTPELPGGIKNREFKKVLGKDDAIFQANKLKELNNEIKSILGFDIFPELMSKLQNVEGIDSHDLDQYIAYSKDVENFFYGHIPDSGELLDNYSQIQFLLLATPSI